MPTCILLPVLADASSNGQPVKLRNQWRAGVLCASHGVKDRHQLLTRIRRGSCCLVCVVDQSRRVNQNLPTFCLALAERLPPVNRLIQNAAEASGRSSTGIKKVEGTNLSANLLHTIRAKSTASRIPNCRAGCQSHSALAQ